MEEYKNKRTKRVGQLVSLGIGFAVFVVLNLVVPRESRSEITFLFFAALAYGLSLLLFTLYRSAAASGLLERMRIRSRIYYLRRSTYALLWLGAILLSILSLIGGIISRSGGVRFLLIYLIPVVLIAAASLMSVEDGSDPDR